MPAGPAPGALDAAEAQLRQYKKLTSSVLSSGDRRRSLVRSASLTGLVPTPAADAGAAARRPSEVLFNQTLPQRDTQAVLLVFLPLGIGVILFIGLLKQYRHVSAAYAPPDAERMRARTPTLWLSFLLCWLAMLGCWALAHRRMRAAARVGDTARYERAQVGFLFVVGLLVNVGEMCSGYIGFGDSAMTFLVFFIFSFGKLGLKRSLLVSAGSLVVYVATALPWVGFRSERGFTASHRIDHTFPIIVYVVFLAVPCYFVEQLQRRKVRVEAQLLTVSAELQAQLELSQHLLLNTLPQEIIPAFVMSADDTLSLGKKNVFAESFSKCSILFAKVVGLDLAHQMNTTDSVKVLNELVCRIDALTDKCAVEKIKTIGDTYMVASGLPTPNEIYHAHQMANFALRMIALLHDFAADMGIELFYKVGVACGSAVAGVLGTKAKLSYDLWGDTVNTASRMCTHCPEGHIQVTEAVHALLRDDFVLEDRGIISVRGKGSMHTYYLLADAAHEAGDTTPTWRQRQPRLEKRVLSISDALRQKRKLADTAAKANAEQAAGAGGAAAGGLRGKRGRRGRRQPRPEQPLRKTHATFASPYAAAWNHWTGADPVARALERDFQRERKAEVRSYLQIFWLVTLFFLVVYLEVVEMAFFCVEDDTCDVRCDKHSIWYTTAWGLRLGRIIKAGFFFPAIILFVLVMSNEQLRVGRGLTRITFVFLLSMGCALAVLVAYTSRTHAYIFLLLIFVINNFTLLQHGHLFLLNALVILTFELLVRWASQQGQVDRWEGEDWYLSFTFEKLLPLAMVALACNHATEYRYRAVFLQLLQLQQQQEEYKTEKHVTEELLRHALPGSMLATLKEGRYPAVSSYGTVMFADMVGFTAFSGRVTPLELVKILNYMFVLYDRVAEKHRVDKLKTLGDCYVASSGVLTHSPDHAEAMCAAAAGLQQAIAVVNRRFSLYLRVRVGMHSGPVIGGVIGSKKFTFDLWGSTVERANLMEAQGIPGRINLSEETHAQASRSHMFVFEHRGAVQMEVGGSARMFLMAERNQNDPRFGLAPDQIGVSGGTAASAQGAAGAGREGQQGVGGSSTGPPGAKPAGRRTSKAKSPKGQASRGLGGSFRTTRELVSPEQDGDGGGSALRQSEKEAGLGMAAGAGARFHV
eukprot:g1592.t1